MEERNFDTDLKKAITSASRKKQKEYLQSLEKSLLDERKISKKIDWRIAASFIILIGSISFYFFNQFPSNNKLYDKYFSPYENIIAPIVRNGEKLSNKEKVFAAYEQGNYKIALTGLDELSVNDTLNISTIQFYKANIYMKLNEFSNSEKLFLKTIKSQEWKNESLWYLALIAIKQNKNSLAIEYLTKLKNSNKISYKKKEIEELMKAIK